MTPELTKWLEELASKDMWGFAWQKKPFRIGDYVCCTDGCFMVGVKDDGDSYITTEIPAATLEILTRHLSIAEENPATVELDKLRAFIDSGTCKVCSGSGKRVCPNCAGRKNYACECSDCGNAHEATCTQCDANGTAECRCFNETRPVWIGSEAFNGNLVHQALGPLTAPTVKISATSGKLTVETGGWKVIVMALSDHMKYGMIDAPRFEIAAAESSS